MKHLTRVGVLYGGPSSEYEVSLQTGANVMSAIRNKYPEKYSVSGILIDRQGNWHKNGMPTSIEEACKHSDVIFNALHGSYGEDGKVQRILELHGVPFTGSGSIASAVAMNKMLAKHAFNSHDLKTPRAKVITVKEVKDNTSAIIQGLFNSWSLPAIVKPVNGGSSVGLTLVRSYNEFPAAFTKAINDGDIMIEEYIPGIEATCGVIEGFRGQELYALPPIEIRPKSGIFDYDAKYAGQSQEIVPATFTETIKKKIEELACKIHRALGLRHYSRSDFIIHPRRGIYILEVNTLPGLTNESLVPKSLRAVGSDTHEFVDHVIGLSLI